ncbi:MAG: hypothetical protein LWX83_09740 [Anaerolineae bacterium]|nr:hypothetical protein [Anaerolineae bacterium]
MRGVKLIYLISLLSVVFFGCTLPAAVNEAVRQQAIQAATLGPLRVKTPTIVYLPSAYTEVNAGGDLAVVRSATLRNLQTLTTYILVENRSSDPSRVVKSINYKISWYDAQGGILAEKSAEYPILVLPLEKSLISLSMRPATENKEHPVQHVRFEMLAVNLVQMEQVMQDRVRSLTLAHPLIHINPGPWKIEEKSFFDDRYVSAVTQVELHNSLNVRIHADVYGFFLGNNGEVVGVAANTDLPIEANTSSVSVLVSPVLSGPVNTAEYYTAVYEYSSWTDPYYSAFE